MSKCLHMTLALVATAVFISAPLHAKPPEWAPAHGYDKDKHDQHDKNKNRDKDKYKDKHKPQEGPRQNEQHLTVPAAAAVVVIPAVLYTPPGAVPQDIAAGRCDADTAVKEAVGTVVGGIIGGLLGAQIGDGSGKQFATLGGAVLGAYIGNQIAGQMDEADYNCTNRTLEYAADQLPVTWHNANSGLVYTLQPLKTIHNDAQQVCREFVTQINADGQTRTINGSACRDNDGVWRAW